MGRQLGLVPDTLLSNQVQSTERSASGTFRVSHLVKAVCHGASHADLGVVTQAAEGGVQLRQEVVGLGEQHHGLGRK